MAEIPVEKKTGGLPWWLIPLLLLLVLIPLLWFMMRGCNTAPAANDNRAVNSAGNANRAANTVGGSGATGTTATNTGNANASTGAVNSTGAAMGDRVTDVNIFGGAADKNTLVGRSVGLTQVKVNRVLSDRVFTVTSGQGEMFVMLNENLDSGGGKEKQIKMQSGQTVNMNGDFRRVPDADTKEEVQNRDLNAKEYAQMKGQQVYLHAQSVEDAK